MHKFSMALIYVSFAAIFRVTIAIIFVLL
jgi:hypothetical protein